MAEVAIQTGNFELAFLYASFASDETRIKRAAFGLKGEESSIRFVTAVLALMMAIFAFISRCGYIEVTAGNCSESLYRRSV